MHSSFFTLAVDTQGRYNYLTAAHEPMGGNEWKSYDSFEPGAKITLAARRGSDGWSLYINDEDVGVLSGFPSRVQYGVMLYPAYGLTGEQLESFPEEPIRFRYRVLEER